MVQVLECPYASMAGRRIRDEVVPARFLPSHDHYMFLCVDGGVERDLDSECVVGTIVPYNVHVIHRKFVCRNVSTLGKRAVGKKESAV